MNSDSRPTFIEFLVEEGLLSRADADKVVHVASKSPALLGQHLLRRKVLTMHQLLALLRRQASKPSKRLGELAVASGYIDDASLQSVLVEQPFCDSRHPIDVLRLQRLLRDDVLVEAMVSYIRHIDPFDPDE